MSALKVGFLAGALLTWIFIWFYLMAHGMQGPMTPISLAAFVTLFFASLGITIGLLFKLLDALEWK